MVRFRSAVIRLGAAFAVLLVLAGVVLWTSVAAIAPRTSLSDLMASLGTPKPGSPSWKVQHNRRINLLLMARGGAGRDNPNVTDAMILLSIQPAAGQAVLISLPRFAWVHIPALTTGDVSGKLYAAYALGVHPDNPSLRPAWRTPLGAGDLAAATVTTLSGLPIDGWVVIDTNAFRDIVDALGGIELSVPLPLDDPFYPVDDTGRTTHIHIAAGHKRLNGEQALEYARSRLSTSDADRAQRQQRLLTAIMARLHHLSVGPSLVFLLGALQNRLLTNLQLSDLRTLAQATDAVAARPTRNVTLDESNFFYARVGPGGDEVLVPRDGTYAALRRYLSAVVA